MKVLTIGIDGADLKIIKEGVKMGMLPTFQSLIDHGIYGELTSTIPPATAPAWVSMTTGVNPGKHGIFDFVDWRQGKINNSLSVKAPTIWDITEKYHMRSVLVNVPLTHPPKRIDGVIVPGIPLSQRMITVPNSVQSLLKRNRYVPDFSEYEALKYAAAGRDKALLDRAKEISENRTALVQDLLSSEKWDFFMVVYIVLDRLQHVSFHRKSTVYQAYKILDVQIEKLLNCVDGDTVVLITSDHGFMKTQKVVYLNEILRREGLIELHRKELLLMYHSVLHLMAMGPQRFLIPEIFEALGNKLGNRMLNFSRGQGQEKAKAKLISKYGRYAYVRLEDPRWRKKVITVLKALKDSDGNIVEDVKSNSTIFQGPYAHEAPELIAKFTKGYSAFTLLGTPKTVVDVYAAPEPMTGIHRREGILLASHRNISKLNGINVKTSIYDVFPTALALLGITIPQWTDGRPIVEILKAVGQTPVFLSKKTVRSKREGKKRVYSREDEEEIKRRLRSLGYI